MPLRVRVTYGRTSDLLTDVEEQVARRGLLVRVELGTIERGSPVELEVVMPGGHMVIDATVLAQLPGAGVAVQLEPTAFQPLVDAAHRTPVTDGPAPVHECLEHTPMARTQRAATVPPLPVASTPGPSRPLGRATTTSGSRGVPGRPTPVRAALDDAYVPRTATRRVGTTPPAGTDAASSATSPQAARSELPGAVRTPAPEPEPEPEAPVIEMVADAADEEPEADGMQERVRAATLEAAAAAQQQAQKIQLALHGDKNQRAAILRENNRLLHAYVLKNPQLQLDEVIFIAKMPTVSADLLATIAGRREWAERPEVARALVRNPKTPVPLAIRLLDHVGEAELRVLAKQQSVRDPIQRAARKKILG